MRIGLMGCGVVAGYGHLPAICATAGLELAALYDPVLDRAVDMAKRFGGEAFCEAEAFFRSGIDAVVITSPAPAHIENVLAAAEHRKPVLCEKPLAMDLQQGRRMIEAMESAGQLLAVGFTYRFSPAALQIRKLVEQRAIGQVRSLRLVYIWNLHGKYAGDGGTLNQRRVGRMLEGGAMVDCGVHQIDLARWWLGSEVVRTHSAGAWVEEYDAPDHMYLHMDHACGAHTVVEISYSYCHTAAEPVNLFTYDLIGTEGIIHYDRGRELFELRSSAGTQRLEWHPEKGFERMYEAFRRALERGEPGDLPTGRDGLVATQLATEATQQAIRQRLRS